MQNRQGGFIKLILFILLLITIGSIFFLIRFEETAYELFLKYFDDQTIEKVIEFLPFLGD